MRPYLRRDADKLVFPQALPSTSRRQHGRHEASFGRTESERPEFPPKTVLAAVRPGKGRNLLPQITVAAQAANDLRGSRSAGGYAAYAGRLKKRAMDFDDLMVLHVRLLQEHTISAISISEVR
jgi:superfamily I DNA/RNA helicase